MQPAGSAPRVSWHRGGQELAPSASLDAFIEAARHGAEFIEVDVRQCRDGVLVCVHDDVVPGFGRVSDVDYVSLPPGARDGVLTLTHFLLALDGVDPERHSGIHLDLKDAGYEIDAVDALVASGREFFATTSNESSIVRLRRERPSVDAYLTIGTSRVGLSGLTLIRQRLAEGFPMRRIRRTGATGIAIHYRLATPLTRWWCRRHGLAIVVWTVDRPAFVESWLQRDIDVLTTNRPQFALRRRLALCHV